jgi:DNA-binding transcriptional LysR family regulator
MPVAWTLRPLKMTRMPAPVPTPTSAPTSRRAKDLPDLRALEAFVAVCEAGSMTLAAKRLGLSQSAVSQLVKVLEQDFGAALFDRDSRPARPTHAGRELHELANGLLSQARALTGQVRATARQNYAHIRLGCVDSFAATVGPALIRALSGAAGQIQMWSGLTPGLSQQLQNRELDLAICTESGVADPRICQRRLFSEAWVAVFPRRHKVRAVKAASQLAALAGELPLIRYSQRSVIGQQIERYLRHVGVNAPRRFEFDATDPLLSLIAAGLGWALSTPLCLWQSRQYLDEVTVVPLPHARLGRRDFFLLTHEGEAASLSDEVARVTRQLLRHETLPAIRSLMPALPADVLSCPEEPA